MKKKKVKKMRNFSNKILNFSKNNKIINKMNKKF